MHVMRPPRRVKRRSDTRLFRWLCRALAQRVKIEKGHPSSGHRLSEFSTLLGFPARLINPDPAEKFPKLGKRNPGRPRGIEDFDLARPDQPAIDCLFADGRLIVTFSDLFDG